MIGFRGSLLFVVAGLFAAAPAARASAAPKSAHTPRVKVAAAQAAKTALAKYPGKVVGAVKLEDEEGVWQYSVMIRSGKLLREVMVNANTGKIATAEVTTAAKEAEEAKGDAAKAKGRKAGKTTKGVKR